MYQVPLEEAKKKFLSLVEKASAGEEIIITKNNIPLLKLVCIPQQKAQAQFGSAKGLIFISDDFDEPLEDFKEYMQ